MARELVILVVVALGIVGISQFVRSEGRPPAPVEDPFDTAFRKAMTKNLEHSAWLAQQEKLLIARGKEYATAGFSLLRPGADPVLHAPHMMSDLLGSPFYDFWQVQRKYTDVAYTVVPGGPNGSIGLEYAEVSVPRLFANTVLSGAQRIATAGGLYKVQVTIAASGMTVLANLLGTPNPTQSYVDWYGLDRNAGEAPTEMQAVLVSDNVAYLPISVSLIVANNMVGQPTMVARDLNQAEASLLVSRLGF